MIGPVNAVDAALIAIGLISGLLAMYRGLAREILSILSWVAAGGAVVYWLQYHPQTADELAKQFNVPSPKVVQIVVGAVIFLLVLIIVHLITARISDAILDSRVGMIDRILGFLFGIVRGFVIILIPYMAYVLFFPKEEQQVPWVQSAKSVQLLLKPAAAVMQGHFARLAPASLTGKE